MDGALRIALLVGLCPLVPVPLVDELLRRMLLRRAYRAAGAAAGATLDDVALVALTESRDSLLWGCLVAVVWWPLKKLFRTAFYVLTIKDCIDWAADATVRIEMVRRAAVAGELPDRPRDVRDRMESSFEGVRTSPVMRFLFREPRLEMMGWPAAGDAAIALLHHLARWGGGSVLLERFVLALPAPSSVPRTPG